MAGRSKHRVRLTATSLAISKHGRVEALHYRNGAIAHVAIDIVLDRLITENRVELACEFVP